MTIASGSVDPGQGLVAGLLEQVELGVAAGELAQLRRAARVDRGDARPASAAQLEQQLGQLAAVGADLEHRARRHRVEAGGQQLAHVGERVADLVGVAQPADRCSCVASGKGEPAYSVNRR